MAFCPNCGKEIELTTKFCSDCGASVRASSAPAIQPIGQQELTKPQTKPTKAWYLVPFFFNLIGGIIGYFAVKNEDRQMANRLLIFGLVMFVLVIVAYFVLIVSALMMFSNV